MTPKEWAERVTSGLYLVTTDPDGRADLRDEIRARVTRAITEAIAEERERCAKIVSAACPQDRMGLEYSEIVRKIRES